MSDILSLFPPTHRIDATIAIPGSKSDTNRALVIASLANGISTLTGMSPSKDSQILIIALRTLGIRIDEDGDTATVYGNGGRFAPFSGTISCGIAGTAARFLSGVLSLVPWDIILDGEGHMRERPMGDLVRALQSLGVQVRSTERDGCLPLRFSNGSDPISRFGREVSLRGGVSSQYFTSLLLIAPILPAGLDIRVEWEQTSKSYIDMTRAILADFAVPMTNDDYRRYRIEADNPYVARTYRIDGDASGSSYLWAIAAVSGSRIRVTNLRPESCQGDVHFPDLLGRMGCIVTKDTEESWIEVTGVDGLRAIDTDMSMMPDTAQTLAIVASFARGTTRITGLSTLRDKETDRIAAIACELEKMGITLRTGSDWIEVDGRKPHGATIDTYDDHRMAMSFAVAGAVVSDIHIRHPDVVRKSFPSFWETLAFLGYGYEWK